MLLLLLPISSVSSVLSAGSLFSHAATTLKWTLDMSTVSTPLHTLVTNIKHCIQHMTYDKILGLPTLQREWYHYLFLWIGWWLCWNSFFVQKWVCLLFSVKFCLRAENVKIDEKVVGNSENWERCWAESAVLWTDGDNLADHFVLWSSSQPQRWTPARDGSFAFRVMLVNM